jgi:hypothetical protein
MQVLLPGLFGCEIPVNAISDKAATRLELRPELPVIVALQNAPNTNG